MSEHYGPFEKYSEVMLGNGGVFGLRAGETLDVQEDGRVVISEPEVAEEEVAEVEELETGGAVAETIAGDGDPRNPDSDSESASGPTYEDEAPVETPAEASEDESPPDAATAFAEAQQNPDE